VQFMSHSAQATCPGSADFGSRPAPAVPQVTEVTRRRFMEGLSGMRIFWGGGMDDAEFLGRLYDLDSLPSVDKRFKSAGRGHLSSTE
jgi:hypothetical protein